MIRSTFKLTTLHRNTYIFAEKDDVSIGEAGWEPGKGRVKRGADGDDSEAPPEKRRELCMTACVMSALTRFQLMPSRDIGRPTLTGVVNVSAQPD
jgi:hypothetical protein